MNWLYFALTVSAILALLWLVTAFRARPAWPAWVGGMGFLFVAGLNSAAPVRGLVDPNYVGFAFGFLRAEQGVMVTLLAGALFVSAVLGAFAALRRERWAMWFTALAAGAHVVNLGIPWAFSTATNIEDNTIQLGEYLTIPGALSTLLMFVLMLAPFLVVLFWSARSALRPAA
jgi:hypothetical protein